MKLQAAVVMLAVSVGLLGCDGGTGGTAGYDATLNGKVLNLAITEAVNNLVTDLENGMWRLTPSG